MSGEAPVYGDFVVEKLLTLTSVSGSDHMHRLGAPTPAWSTSR